MVCVVMVLVTWLGLTLVGLLQRMGTLAPSFGFIASMCFA